jgi:hypothetical protein
VASIVSSIVTSKFLHCTILENFNLKWTRIQRGMDLGCCWMLFFLQRRVCWPAFEECYGTIVYFIIIGVDFEEIFVSCISSKYMTKAYDVLKECFLALESLCKLHSESI